MGEPLDVAADEHEAKVGAQLPLQPAGVAEGEHEHAVAAVDPAPVGTARDEAGRGVLVGAHVGLLVAELAAVGHDRDHGHGGEQPAPGAGPPREPQRDHDARREEHVREHASWKGVLDQRQASEELPRHPHLRRHEPRATGGTRCARAIPGSFSELQTHRRSGARRARPVSGFSAAARACLVASRRLW